MRRKKGQLIPIERSILTAAVQLRSQGVDEFHGFRLAKEIKDQEGARLLTAHGTLYRALGRLEQQGFLHSTWEDPMVAAEENRPRRKLYRLTGVPAPAPEESSRSCPALVATFMGDHVVTATRLEMLCHGWALPAATSMVSAWTWLYTAALSEQVRTARREEIRSDLHDQMAQDREQGVSPARTAIHILCRMVMGARDDMGWSLPHIPSALAGHLIRGSDAIGQTRPSPWAISALAVLGLMNWVLAMSDRHHPWFEWLLVNAAVLAIALLLHTAEAFLGRTPSPVVGHFDGCSDRRYGYPGSSGFPLGSVARGLRVDA